MLRCLRLGFFVNQLIKFDSIFGAGKDIDEPRIFY